MDTQDGQVHTMDESGDDVMTKVRQNSADDPIQINMEEEGQKDEDSSEKQTKKSRRKYNEKWKDIPRRTRPTRVTKAKPVERLNIETENKWSVIDKQRLLEGIRKYSPHHPDILSKVVVSKTPTEVANFIRGIRDFNFRVGLRQKEDRRKRKTAIESWTELVREMVAFEPEDYSEQIPKIFGIIARNEEFAPSRVPRLDWRKIYMFISDMLDDKDELVELSDVESHVVLDMMRGLGDCLYSCDTDTQTRLLTTKYQLLQTKLEYMTEQCRNWRTSRLNMALSNKFDYSEEASPVNNLLTQYDYEPSSSAAASSSSNPDEPSTSRESEAPDDDNGGTQAEERSVPKVKPISKPSFYSLNPLNIPNNLLSLHQKVEEYHHK